MPGGMVQRGIVTGYDSTTMTAVVTPYDNSGIISNVVCSFSRYDPVNGAFGVTPPCIGAPCLFTQSGGETFIISTFPPVNLTSYTSSESVYDASMNRTPEGMSGSGTISGNSYSSTSMGAEESFSDMIKKIVLNPGKLSSVWNLLNCIWENCCTQLRIYSGGLDIISEADGGDCTDTIINVRKSVAERVAPEGTDANGEPLVAESIINLQMGNTADIITLKINGEEFLHIDEERNVTITAKKVTLNATEIIFNAEEFNCLNVGSVKLP